MQLKFPMTFSSYQDTVSYFAQLLESPLPAPHLTEGQNIEIQIDNQKLELSPASQRGGINMQICLGLMLQPIPLDRLKELMSSNLGINTGGCTICLDEKAVGLYLKTTTTPGTSAQENWEWMHRLLHVAKEWNKILALWQEFVSLSNEVLLGE